MNIEEHVTLALQEVVKEREPFPCFFARNVFPADFYTSLMAELELKKDFHNEQYANRSFADSIGIPELDFMKKSVPFFRSMLGLFEEDLQRDFAGKQSKFHIDVRLIRDSLGYKIGPHTDASWKVLSLLFYLPKTNEHSDCGTAVYVPKMPDFRCPGGPHYSFDDFTEVWRAPFAPNSCLGFWKTDKSFHGVPPLPVQFQRDVLLYNVYRQQPPGPKSQHQHM